MASFVTKDSVVKQADLLLQQRKATPITHSCCLFRLLSLVVFSEPREIIIRNDGGLF